MGSIIQDIKNSDLPFEEKKRLMLEAYAKVKAKAEELIALNPYWYFKPNSGEIDEKKKAFLLKYLKEEDIPQKLDSQLDVLLSKANIVGASGGNQSGKSTIGAIRGVIKSTGELPKTLEEHKEHPAIKRDIERVKRKKFIRGRVVGVDHTQFSNTVLPAWKMWVPKEYLKDGDWSKSYSAELKTLTLYRKNSPCATIEFKTNAQDKDSFQGPPLDWLIYDEEPRQDIHKENLMRFVTSEYVDITFCWTPTKGLSWATDLFMDDELEDNNKLDLFKLCSVTNQKANLDSLDEIVSEIKNYDELKMRLLGEAVSLSGLIYAGYFNVRVHVIEPFELDATDYMVVRGIDPHTSKPTTCIELAVDREENKYVVGTYMEAVDTQVIKDDLAARATERGYRLGWTRCDKSADSTNRALSDRNIYKELAQGENAIPAMGKSEKFTGSIHAGVDAIKKDLKLNEITGKPKLYIFNIPENKILINAMRTIERETYANEDKKGLKDQIAEGKHDTHAALRYIYQKKIHFVGPSSGVPEYEPANKVIGY